MHPPAHHREPWHRSAGDPGAFLDLMLDRVVASREQEKVIREQARRLHAKVASMRGEARRTREDLARALRADSFDENVMGDLFVRHDDELHELRNQAVEFLANVHEVLDERQRERLADFIDRAHPFGFGGPYRGVW